MKTKIITSIALFVFIQSSFGQTDTNVLAVGDWSAPVKDSFYPLRGRLLVYKPLPQGDTMKEVGLWYGARVYVELQLVDVYGYRSGNPTEIFIDRYLPMQAEMRDSHDKLIIGDKNGWHGWDGPLPPQFTVTVPFDSTLRLRAHTEVATQRPDVLLIAVPESSWTIPLSDTNQYFLSATFSPTTNNPSALNYHMWHGTLQLPKVKIPVEKLRKP